jgi:DNA-binding CsgD family transcriptional regulator
LAEGYSTREIASALETSSASVSGLLGELRAELLVLAARGRVLDEIERLSV